jgi:hypothetical protein
VKAVRELIYRRAEIGVQMDPTSDLNEGRDAEDVPACETCGDPLTDRPDRRVITWVEDDQVRSVQFCDEDCRENWTRE